MNINNAFPSKYLKSGEVPEEGRTLTISKVIIENVGQGEEQEEKPVIYFYEDQKGMVLNKTNAGIIAGLYTPETDAWIGKPITIFSTQVDFAGKQTLALRVKMRVPPPTASWKDTLVQLANEAKALHAIEKDAVKGARLNTALDTGRTVYALNGSASPDAISKALGDLRGAINEAKGEAQPF